MAFLERSKFPAPVRKWKPNKMQMKEQYCWAITQAGGRLCCRRSGSCILDFGYPLDSLLCTYAVDKYVSHIPTCAKFYSRRTFQNLIICVSRWVSLFLKEIFPFCTQNINSFKDAQLKGCRLHSIWRLYMYKPVFNFRRQGRSKHLF